MSTDHAGLIEALLATGHREPELRRLLQRAFGTNFISRLPLGDDGLRGFCRRARVQLEREGWTHEATLFDAVRAGGLVSDAQVREVAEPLGVWLSDDAREGGDIAGALAGRYRRFEAVDDGPSTVVYRGSDRRLRVLDVRAIKVLKPAVARDRRAVQAFLDDCANMVLIGHPRVVRALTVDEDRGLPFLVLDFLEGGSLRQRFAGGQALPEDDAARITLQILEGLEEIHHARVIHRRLNPSNILFDGAGDVRLGDFTSPRLDRSPVPQDQLPAYTQGYLAPEQRTPVTPPDRRADIYAVGVLLASMLLGEERGRDLATESEWEMAKAWIPPRLQPVIRAATRPLPEDRYPDAGSMRADLLSVLNGGARVATPEADVRARARALALADRLPAQPMPGPPTSAAVPTMAMPTAAEIAPSGMAAGAPEPPPEPAPTAAPEPGYQSWLPLVGAAGVAVLVAGLLLVVMYRFMGPPEREAEPGVLINGGAVATGPAPPPTRAPDAGFPGVATEPGPTAAAPNAGAAPPPSPGAPAADPGGAPGAPGAQTAPPLVGNVPGQRPPRKRRSEDTGAAGSPAPEPTRGDAGRPGAAGMAKVSISADEAASAWIEGEFAGALPLQGRPCPAGSVTVQLRRQNGPNASFVLNLDPGQALSVRWSFADGVMKYD